MSDTQIAIAQLFQQGKTHRMNGEYDQAIALLQRAIQEQPDFAEAHLELGLAYCFTGLFDESIQELELASKLDPTNPEIRLHLGKTYTMLGMYDEGKQAFRTVMQMTPPGDKHHDEASRQLAYF